MLNRRCWYRITTSCLLALLTYVLLASMIVSLSSNYVLYVLGDPSCPACAALKTFLDREGLPYIFCPLYGNYSCAFSFSILIESYNLPPYIPTTLVISDDCIKAVVIGAVRNVKFWESLASSKVKDYVPVYMGKKLKMKLNVSPKALLSQLIPNTSILKHLTKVSSTSASGGASSTTSLIPLGLIATLAGLALSDAVNPCATYIYVLLLTASALTAMRSRRKRILVGTSTAFILAVFIGYYMLGVGLIKVMGYVPPWALSLIAIAFGVWVILSALTEKSRVLAKTSLLNMVRKAKTSIIMSAVLGFIITFTLLPCSSGPYVVFTGLIAKYPLTTSLSLLALYNLIFVSPLILITLLVANIMKVRKVHEMIVKYNKHFSIIAGIILIAIGIYVLFMH